MLITVLTIFYNLWKTEGKRELYPDTHREDSMWSKVQWTLVPIESLVVEQSTKGSTTTDLSLSRPSWTRSGHDARPEAG